MQRLLVVSVQTCRLPYRIDRRDELVGRVIWVRQSRFWVTVYGRLNQAYRADEPKQPDFTHTMRVENEREDIQFDMSSYVNGRDCLHGVLENGFIWFVWLKS